VIKEILETSFLGFGGGEYTTKMYLIDDKYFYGINTDIFHGGHSLKYALHSAGKAILDVIKEKYPDDNKMANNIIEHMGGINES
jgi:hypothetical protein